MKVSLVQRVGAPLAAATLLAAALAPLAAAQEPLAPSREPQTFTVAAGGFDEPNFVTVNAFLPDTLTVDEGDTITWNINGFHTVTFPGGGQAPPPPIMPDPSNPQQVVVNPTAAAPTQGNSFDGSSLANSGLPPETATGPVTFSLTFPKAGSYSYVCVVHPAMVGTVTVQASGDRPMTPEQVAAAEQEIPEYTQAVVAKEASINAANVQPVWAGVVAAGGKAESLHFAPGNVTIQAGQSVTWKMDPQSQEPHTVTFLSGGAPVEFITPGPESAGGPPAMVLNPQAINPAGGPSYNGSGYVNSGLIAAYPMGPGQPPHDTYTLTFSTPGTYNYYCIVHGPDMSGIVTVLGANGVAPSAQVPAVQVPSSGK